jgi:Rap1a immunity proteins
VDDLMKRAITAASITLTVLANMSGAIAQTKPGTTQWLYEQCSSADRGEQDTCSAYLLGVAGVMETAGGVYENAPKMAPKEWAIPLGAFGICLSSSVNGADVRQVFTDWAEKNPSKRDTKMPQGAMAALLAKWGCKPPN